jgi:hypothetical protein
VLEIPSKMFCDHTIQMTNHKLSHISNEKPSRKANQKARHTNDAKIHETAGNHY